MKDLQKQFKLYSLDEPGSQASQANQKNSVASSALEEALRTYSKNILDVLRPLRQVRVDALLAALQQNKIDVKPGQLLELLDRLAELGVVQLQKDQPLNPLVSIPA